MSVPCLLGVCQQSCLSQAAGEDEEKLITWHAAKPLHFSTALIPPCRGYAIFPRMVSCLNLKNGLASPLSMGRAEQACSEPVLLAEALMNHSCKPSCGIEFDFAGRIFVLQQPYIDIKPGQASQGESESGVHYLYGGVELTISYLDSSLEAEERLRDCLMLHDDAIAL